MTTLRNTLAHTTLFEGLDDTDLDSICAIAVEKRLERGEAIFLEGDPAGGFYVVAEGQVKIFKLSADGKEQILHIYGPGHPFGEVPMFSGHRFPANAQTTVASRLIFLPRAAFVEAISGNPSLAMNMLAVLSLRLRQFTVQIENLSLKEVPGRLASYLLVASGERGSPDSVTLNISKGQLASLLGTIPETLSRIFSKMTEQGLIQVDGKTIRIADREGIEALAAYGRLGG